VDSIRDMNEFKHTISLSNDILNKDYLTQLKSMSLAAISNTTNSTSIQLIKLKNIPEVCCPSILETMIPVLAALHHLDVTIGYILQVTPTQITAYLAIKSVTHIDTALNLLESALNIKCSNLLIEVISEKEKQQLLNKELFNAEKVSSLSSVVINPAFDNPSPKSVFTELKALYKCMANEEYILFFLASPIQKKQVRDSIYQLENLFTLLHSFKETTFTYNFNTSATCTNNISHSDSKSFSHTVADSETITIAKELDCKKWNTLIFNDDVNECIDYVISTQNIKDNATKNICATCHTLTDAEQTTLGHSTSDGEANVKGNSTTYCFKGENKTAIELLKKADFVLNKLYSVQNLPQFNLGIYFLAPSSYTTLRAAFTYLDLFEKDKECLQDSSVTTWDSHETTFDRLLYYLSELSHPSFFKSRSDIAFTPTAFIDNHSLAHLMCMPTLPPLI